MKTGRLEDTSCLPVSADGRKEEKGKTQRMSGWMEIIVGPAKANEILDS